MHLIEIQDVTKSYASKVAVNQVTLNIPRGSLFGLLGPNGAGKTSLIRMITRITFPDSGQIRYEGQKLNETHQQLIGYMPEERGLYRKMKVGDHVVYLLRLKGLSGPEARRTADEWLERFDLMQWRSSKVQELSKGMQQKVQFIGTIGHRPPLLILDEPFSGLDPINARLMEEVMREFRDAGKTVIFSTHRMEQVQEFCDRLAMINNGRIIVEEELLTLRRQYRKNIYTVETEEEQPTLPDMPAGAVLLHHDSYELQIALEDGGGLDARGLLEYLNQHLHIVRFEQYTPGVREIFIELVEKSNEPLPQI